MCRKQKKMRFLSIYSTIQHKIKIEVNEMLCALYLLSLLLYELWTLSFYLYNNINSMYNTNYIHSSIGNEKQRSIYAYIYVCKMTKRKIDCVIYCINVNIYFSHFFDLFFEWNQSTTVKWRLYNLLWKIQKKVQKYRNLVIILF